MGGAPEREIMGVASRDSPGHWLVWHLRIMMQPSVMSGAVEKPNSSAPSSAAMATSRPVRS